MAGRLIVIPHRRRVAVIEQDQVDIARIIEFAGAKLAHAQHGKGGCVGIAVESKLSVARELQEHGIDQRLQAIARETAQGGGDLGERPGAGDVGHRDH